MVLNLRRALGFRVSQGALEGLFVLPAWNLIDWAPLPSPPGTAFTHENALLAWALGEVAAVADARGRTAEAREFGQAAQNLRTTIRLRMWDGEHGRLRDGLASDGTWLEGGSVHAQVFGLLSGAVDGDVRQRCLDLVLRPPTELVPIASPFAEFFRMQVLAEAGHHRQLFDQIRRTWGRMLRHDARTCWEGWSFLPGQLTRSHCHAWSASPLYFLPAWAAGIRPLEPGFARFSFNPQTQEVGWIRCRVPTPAGLIELEAEAGEAVVMAPADLEAVPGKGWVLQARSQVSGVVKTTWRRAEGFPAS